jgi:hypothetical protein
MTVTATSYTPLTYNGNGSTSVFNITFQFYEVAVIHIDSSGSETEWTENTHYTVTGGEGSTGSITATPTVPATGEKLRIERRTSKDQPRDYDLDNAVLEAALQQSDDRLAMILQELDYDNRRRPAISTANFTAEVEFPTASTGSVLSWAADGNLANTALVDLDGVAISALSTTTSLEDTDLLPLYDQSVGDNAAITWANVKSGLGLGALAALGTVDTAQIEDDAVTAAKVLDGVITTSKLASGAVTNDKILDATIANAKLATPPKILQVVQATSSTHQSTTSTSYVDCTGMSASITPSSTSSKILVEVHFQGWHENSYGGLVKMLRDATEVGSGVAPSGSNAAMFQIRSLDVKTMQANSIVFLDEPASASALTYKLQMKTTNAGSPTYMNRPSTVNSDNCGVISSITLKEITG